jgi:hypothetical protein
MRIAISYQQDRIAPVFDVSARVLLVDIENGLEVRRNERTLVQEDPLDRARLSGQTKTVNTKKGGGYGKTDHHL